MATALPDSPRFLGDPGALFANLRRAWERFVTDGRLSAGGRVRRDVLESRRCCLKSQLDPHTRRAPRGLGPEEIAELLQNDDFAIAGRQVVSDFAVYTSLAVAPSAT